MYIFLLFCCILAIKSSEGLTCPAIDINGHKKTVKQCKCQKCQEKNLMNAVVHELKISQIMGSDEDQKGNG